MSIRTTPNCDARIVTRKVFTFRLAFPLRGRVVAALLMLAPALGSCNPDLVNSLSGGSQVPLAPGSAPFVQVFVYNLTQLTTIDFLLTTDGVSDTLTNIFPLVGSAGVLYSCPTGRIGLGNLDDPESLTGAFAFGPTFIGSSADLKVPIAFNQNPLVEGISYQCGDTIFIAASDDSRSSSGISFSMAVYSGAQQPPVSDIETFQVVQNVLLREGFTF